jgi:prolyl oligopeptidase
MRRRTSLTLAAVTLTALLGAPIRAAETDPFLWLEDVTGEKALAWVKEKNAISTAELTGSDAFRAMDKRLLDILDSKERIPNVDKMGPYYYNFWRDAKNTRGLWRRTTSEYRCCRAESGGDHRSDALSTAENENWVWQRSTA